MNGLTPQERHRLILGAATKVVDQLLAAYGPEVLETIESVAKGKLHSLVRLANQTKRKQARLDHEASLAEANSVER